jgi:hypothetical protein
LKRPLPCLIYMKRHPNWPRKVKRLYASMRRHPFPVAYCTQGHLIFA